MLKFFLYKNLHLVRKLKKKNNCRKWFRNKYCEYLF